MKPKDILVNEHRIIEQVLNCLEQIVERCASEGRLEVAPACEAVGFFPLCPPTRGKRCGDNESSSGRLHDE